MPPENDERRDYSVLIAVIEERLSNYKYELDKTINRLEKKVDENNLICVEVTRISGEVSKLKGALGVLGTIGSLLFGGIITWIFGLWGNK